MSAPLDSFRTGRVIPARLRRQGSVGDDISKTLPPRPASCDIGMRFNPKRSDEGDLPVARPNSCAPFQNEEVRKELSDGKKQRPKSSHDFTSAKPRPSDRTSHKLPRHEQLVIKKKELEFIDDAEEIGDGVVGAVKRRYFINLAELTAHSARLGAPPRMNHFDAYVPSAPADSDANELRRLYYCDFLVPAPPPTPLVPVSTPPPHNPRLHPADPTKHERTAAGREDD